MQMNMTHSKTNRHYVSLPVIFVVHVMGDILEVLHVRLNEESA